MNFPADAQDWLDVIDHSIVVVGAVIVALIPGWLSAIHNHRAIKDVERKTDAIKGQVVNGHPEPLRADLDRLAADVGELRAEMRTLMDRMSEWSPLIPLVRSFAPEIAGLRGDLAEERESRRTLAADVRADMARNRDEVSDLHKRLRDASK